MFRRTIYGEGEAEEGVPLSLSPSLARDGITHIIADVIPLWIRARELQDTQFVTISQTAFSYLITRFAAGAQSRYS